jgi:hypothetical protein
MSWSGLAKAPNLKSLSRVAQKLRILWFCLSAGKRTTKYKVKGVALNYEISKDVHFTSLRKMILEDGGPVHVHNPKNIKRKHGGVVV